MTGAGANTAVDPPTGIVTVLLGDVEGSTPMWEADPTAAALAMRRLQELVGEAVGRWQGHRPLEQGEGDNFVAVFRTASDATSCALDLQRAISAEPWPATTTVRVRMGLHTDELVATDGGRYQGGGLNRCARLRDLGAGGQVLLSGPTHDLVADRLPAGARLLDLGSHTLRGLSRPERVHQLCHPDLPGEFPALPSGGPLGNLPAQRTPLVGRAGELEALHGLVQEHRQVTLTGVGGVGKTRLALELATAVAEEYPDGTWFVDLAPLAEAAEVSMAVAAAVGVPGDVSGDRLTDDLRRRRLLLVLDNCEHLVDAAGEVVATLVDRCPDVAVLATTREPLGIPNETLFRIPPLSVPAADADLEDVLGSDAVALFAERAARARNGFVVDAERAGPVAAICRRLEGLPLALELAAARVRIMPVATIAEGLDDCFAVLGGGVRRAVSRQQTLEASLQWSYGLLTSTEQTVLRRCGAFAGSFDLAAAEAVCADGHVDAYVIFEPLVALVERSLVETTEGADRSRYRLLEPVRQFAVARLLDAGEVQPTRDRHLAHFVHRSFDLYPALERGDPSALEALDEDYDNLRLAVSWGVDHGDAQAAQHLVGNATFYWGWRRAWSEGLHWIATALRGQPIEDAYVPALLAGTFYAAQLGQPDLATEWGEAARESASRTGDERFEAWAHTMLAVAFDTLGDLDRARALLEAALEADREVVGDAGYANAAGRLAAVELFCGEVHQAARHLQDACETLSASSGVESTQWEEFLGEMLVRARIIEGDLDAAERVFDRTCEVIGRRGDVPPFVHLAGGHLAAVRGDVGAAERSFAALVTLTRSEGERYVPDGFSFLECALLRRTLAEIPSATMFLAELDAADAPNLRTPRFRAHRLLAEGVVHHACGSLETAQDTLERARAEAAAGGVRLLVATATLSLAQVAIDDGRDDDARILLHDALGGLFEMGVRLAAVEVLEELAGVMARQAQGVEAARLIGAATAARAHAGAARTPAAEERTNIARLVTQEALGVDVAVGAEVAGAAMSLEEAVVYVQRGRGGRRRPATGWKSLTPSEQQVAGLVAEGLTNKDVAARLFVSTSTVKTHLEHVFAKLGVRSRSELARVHATQATAPD